MSKDHRGVSLAEFTEVMRQVLLSRPSKCAQYENRKPTKEEQSRRWRLVRKP